MITYEKLIESISEIVNNELIYKKGLELVYTLKPKHHKKLSEHFFYKINDDKNAEYEYTDEFEVDIADIVIKFIIDED
jgi:hypothetical protein